MSLWVEQKYANQLQLKLERFKVKKTNPYSANFRCPFCGDSERNRAKTRGYIYEKKGRLKFKCHNCQENMSFYMFIGKVAPQLFDEYRMELFRDRGGTPYTSTRATHTQTLSATYTPIPKINGLVKISSLEPGHIARKYVDSRLIPKNQQFRLYHVDKFKEWVNTMLPGTFDLTKGVEEPRLVMPFKTSEGRTFGFNARSYDPKSALRYISIMLDEDEEHPKVFGLEVCDLNRDSFIFEGPIDSLFVENSLAMAGASVADVKKFMSPSRAIFVFDNEPRNKSILAQMKRTIDEGHRVVIFPDSNTHKDINDMIKDGGMCQEEVSVMLHKNTYQGARALLRFNEWKKA